MSNNCAQSDVIVAVAISAVGLIGLEVAARAGLTSPLLVAAPSDVVSSAPLLIEEGLGDRFVQTFGAALTATGLGCLIGLPLGWSLAIYRPIDHAFKSWVAVVASAPLILLYPLFLVAFGRSLGTIVAIGAISAIPPILLNTRDGLKGVKRTYIEVAQTFGFTRAEVIRKVMLPAAMPSILTGVRLGMVFALVNIVAVEYVINYGGIGALVGEMADRYEIGAMYGAISAIVFASAAFYIATERAERWLYPT